MAVTKEELYRMIDALDPEQRNYIFGVIQAVSSMKEASLSWDVIAHLEADSEPLNAEELRQFNSPDEYITFKQAKKEYGL